jgi:DNA-binding NtrC family response regulator
MPQRTVLVADRDDALRRSLRDLLRRERLQVIEATNHSDSLAFFQGETQAAAIVGNIGSTPLDSLELARQIREWDRSIPIVLLAVNSSEDLAIAAVRAGLNDYFKPPILPEEIVNTVRRLAGDNPNPLSQLVQAGANLIDGSRIVGDSLAMRRLKAGIARVSPPNCNVLITGDTGTGKELAAELIHQNSPRRTKPFVCVNCAAIPDSLLETELFGYVKGAFTGADTPREGLLKFAEGGTVFLDEIGDMSAYAQAKILRVVETKGVRQVGGKWNESIDVKFIAATNQDLEKLVTGGRFRSDLFFRLNVASIHLPPLKDRKEDIPQLLQHYLRDLNQRFLVDVVGFTSQALDCLLNHDWPGNIRELKNLLETIFINRLPLRKIALTDLPERLRKPQHMCETLRKSERELLLDTLAETDWNKSKAALKLRWSRVTLYRKMAKYDLQVTRSRKRPDGTESVNAMAATVNQV